MKQLDVFTAVDVAWRSGPEPGARFTAESVGGAIGCVWPFRTARDDARWLWFVSAAEEVTSPAGGRYWVAGDETIATGTTSKKFAAEACVLRVLSALGE